MSSYLDQPYWYAELIITAYSSDLPRSSQLGHPINVQGIIPVFPELSVDEVTDYAHRAAIVKLAAESLIGFAERQLEDPTPAWLEAAQQEGITHMSTVANKRLAAIAERNAPFTTNSTKKETA